MLAIQVEMFLVRKEATKVKILTGPYFTIRKTTCNPFYIKYDHTLWLNIYMESILVGKNRLN